MFTYKFFVHQSGRLWLRLRNNNKKVEMSMEIEATPDDLIVATTTPKGMKSRLGKIIYTNSAILNIISEQLSMHGRRDEDVKTIRDMFLERVGKKKPEEPKNTFLGWFRQFAESKTKKGTRGVYEHTISRMLDFDKSLPKRKFEDIDLKWLADFEAFCAQTASKNARNIHLRNIRAVFNNAIDYEITTAYPFRRFKIRPEATRKRSLTVEDIRAVFNYPVEPYAEIYRDMFKLSFMLCGINTVDLHGLKQIANGRVEYKRAKTGRMYSIKVEPEAMEIIQKYQGVNGLLCIADRWSDSRNFRHQLNKALQKIGEVERKGRGGKKTITPAFPGLSSYWARHTWATIARKIGVSVDDIALALGHSDGNHETTFIYINDDEIRDAVDVANRRVLDYVLYGKS